MNNDPKSKGAEALTKTSATLVTKGVIEVEAKEKMPPPLPNETKRKKKRWGCLSMGALVVIVGGFMLWHAVEPFTVMARYAGEAIPCLGHLRVISELYRYEENRLPGLGLNADGTVAETSQLATGLSRVQTFSGTEPAAWTADFSKIVAVTNGNHFARAVDVSPEDVTGHPLHPQHVQYRVDACESNAYAYAVGVFGDGEGLMAGTGYAVMEVRNQKAETCFVFNWERYSLKSKKPKQVVMVNAEEAKRYFGCDSAEQARKMNICWVGDADALMSGNKARVEQAMQALQVAGWH